MSGACMLLFAICMLGKKQRKVKCKNNATKVSDRKIARQRNRIIKLNHNCNCSVTLTTNIILSMTITTGLQITYAWISLQNILIVCDAKANRSGTHIDVETM